MNQILQTDGLNSKKNSSFDNNKKGFNQKSFDNMNKMNGNPISNNGKLGLNSIVRIFAISMLIFGIALVGNSSISLAKSAKQKANQKIPSVNISRKGNLLNLSVKSEVPIRSVGFSWNNQDFQYASARQQKQFNMNIKVIDGIDNKLNIAVVDMSNKKSTYHGKYSKEADTTKPEIVIANEDPKIKITITDDTALNHVTYKYGDGDEQRVEADSNDPSKLEIYIDNVYTEQTELIIEAVDNAQNHAEVTKKVLGTTRPKIEVSNSQEDSSILQIKITDKVNLQKVVIYKNDQRYDTSEKLPSINDTLFTAKLRVAAGDVLKIEAYNINELMSNETFNF